VPVNTQVRIINEPVKLAWVDGELYMEARWPLNRMGDPEEPDLKILEGLLLKATADRPVAINWDLVRETLRMAQGIPTVVALEEESEIDIPPQQTPEQIFPPTLESPIGPSFTGDSSL
jgi:hypothetical protein